jgi:hypothetical protein
MTKANKTSRTITANGHQLLTMVVTGITKAVLALDNVILVGTDTKTKFVLMLLYFSVVSPW